MLMFGNHTITQAVVAAGGGANFSFHPLAGRYNDEDWKFDWEKSYVKNSDGNIFRNTFRDIAEAANTLAPEGIKEALSNSLWRVKCKE